MIRGSGQSGFCRIELAIATNGMVSNRIIGVQIGLGVAHAVADRAERPGNIIEIRKVAARK